MSDIVAITTGGDERRQAVRSRLWHALQSNLRRQFLVALDALEAMDALGERTSSLASVAIDRVCELLLDQNETLLNRLAAG